MRSKGVAEEVVVKKIDVLAAVIPSPRTSWRTTACGYAFAALMYWSGIGFKIPQTKQEWATFLGSVVVIVWGSVQRDAKVSQVEHQEEKVEKLINDVPKIIKP